MEMGVALVVLELANWHGRLDRVLGNGVGCKSRSLCLRNPYCHVRSLSRTETRSFRCPFSQSETCSFHRPSVYRMMWILDIQRSYHVTVNRYSLLHCHHDTRIVPGVVSTRIRHAFVSSSRATLRDRLHSLPCLLHHPH
jgi:hypothetical protein